MNRAELVAFHPCPRLFSYAVYPIQSSCPDWSPSPCFPPSDNISAFFLQGCGGTFERLCISLDCKRPDVGEPTETDHSELQLMLATSSRARLKPSSQEVDASTKEAGHSRDLPPPELTMGGQRRHPQGLLTTLKWWASPGGQSPRPFYVLGSIQRALQSCSCSPF